MKMSGLFALLKAVNKVKSIKGFISMMILIILSLLFLTPHPGAEAQMQFWPTRTEYQMTPGMVFDPGYTGDYGMINAINQADFDEDGHDDLIFLKGIISGGTTTITLEVMMWDDTIGEFKRPTVSTNKVLIENGSYVLGNFNNDAHIDLAMVDKIEDIGDVIYLYAGNGDGSFTVPDPATFYRCENVVPAAFLDNSLCFVNSVADINLDGRQDLIISVAWEDKTGPAPIEHGYISVLLGNGDGTFSAPVLTGDLGTVFYNSTVADFNGDDVPDLAFSYNWQTTNAGVMTHNSARSLLGNGDGTFTLSSQIDNMGTWSIQSADFNGDGNMDLAALLGDSDIQPVAGGSTYGYAFLMSLGNGDGTFAPARVYKTGDKPRDMSSADFNMDGFADIAITNSADKTISLFLWDDIGGDFPTPPIIIKKGDFEGYFSPVWFADPNEIVTGDFNNDGHTDMAATSYDYSTITIFFGDGTGQFVETPTFDTDNTEDFSTMIVADVNGDGLGDMVSTAYDFTYDDVTETYTHNHSYLNVYMGDGAGVFAAPVQYNVDDYPTDLIAEDFNNDGAIDFASLSPVNDSVTILLGNNLGVFSEVAGSPFAVNHNPAGMQTGDFNNDGNPDLVTVNIEAELIVDENSPVFRKESGSVSILLGDGTGAFAAASGSPFDTVNAPNAVSISDFNNDGNDDLAIVSISECSFSVYLSNGNGAFTLASTNDALCPEPLLPEEGLLGIMAFILSTFSGKSFSVFSGDFDGDGSSDILITNSSDQTLKVFWGDGAGNFNPTPLESHIGYGQGDQVLFFDLSLPAHFGTADLNGDGEVELLATNGAIALLFTISLDRNGTVVTKSGYTLGGLPTRFTSGDIDGDGNPDIITKNVDMARFEQNISILFNNSPAVPTNLSATATSSSSIRLDWTDSSDDETGFVVERSADGGASWTEITSGIPAGTISWTDNGLTEITSYLYRMRSRKGKLRSQLTSEASATTLCRPPADPVSLSVAADSWNQITLNWDGTAVTDELGYLIEHSDTGQSGSWVEIATVGTDIQTYQHQGLTGNTPHYYRVRAYRDCGAGTNVYSNYTPEAGATTLCSPPADPVSLSLAIDSCNQITLNWDGTAGTNELGYLIEHSDTGLSGSWMEIATVGTDIQTYQHQGLTGDTPNYYRVRAYKDCGAETNVYSNYTPEAEAGVVDMDGDGVLDCSDLPDALSERENCFVNALIGPFM